MVGLIESVDSMMDVVTTVVDMYEVVGVTEFIDGERLSIGWGSGDVPKQT